jgi:hypothetical protein
VKEAHSPGVANGHESALQLEVALTFSDNSNYTLFFLGSNPLPSDRLPPKYSEAYKRRMALGRNTEPATGVPGAASTSNLSLTPSLASRFVYFISPTASFSWPF